MKYNQEPPDITNSSVSRVTINCWGIMKGSEFLKFIFASNYRFFSLSVWTRGGGGGDVGRK